MEPDYYGLKHRRLLEDARRKREDGTILFFSLFFSSLFLFLVGFGLSVILIAAGVIILLMGVLLFIYEDSQSRKLLDKASEMESPSEKKVEKEVESAITDLLIEGISYLMKND
ncbi:MAG: hypothetical protein APG12_00394 [Candidatus Methanofastidiosum methylothiophilum]|uniref:Uncharacterized protein n=1 Tax=Candidatus Methanofastidiosum methylothiophilum TaxID=1705564 RepID=A0A150J145_9EURY|nr:MAG: hypothetical protein APG10_00275 [Candidatus Methanofastidiosum methylthiophilus]KYC48302.1 MAG: hypothetical protein APG11_00425 [Candidatus Methanofastidiosum methylthiophilus]KYC50971.1 MAG: hypothetical protein APG12_00394 [Candidatus Methanofastidiosum methylthiophilus]